MALMLWSICASAASVVAVMVDISGRFIQMCAVLDNDVQKDLRQVSRDTQ